MSIGKTIVYICVVALLVSCGTSKKASLLKEEQISAQLVLPAEKELDFTDLSLPQVHRDTMVIQDFMGNDVIIMNAIRDEETGEMVANETLDAAVVTARFRNVAERHGKVDVEFQLIVPEQMLDSRWQARFSPVMYILDDTLKLDDVFITGSDYRKAQLKGYQQYERFIRSIVTDTTEFINLRQLEIFIERNIPELYRYKNSDEYVSDEEFASVFGVTEDDAVDYYTNKLRYRYNEWKKHNTGRVYNRYVKSPIVTENLRLDTIMRASTGEFIYNYVQTIETRPMLRKVDIVLAGNVYEQERKVYNIPESEPLTFYISSLSAFVDNTERYLTKVVERRVEANTECNIEFEVAKDVIKPELADNEREISRIKENLASLIENHEYDLDSIVITAAASPEGGYATNEALSRRRSQSVTRYFEGYIRNYVDSLEKERGLVFNLDEEYEMETPLSAEDIKFVSCYQAEGWEHLDELVENDYNLNDGDRELYWQKRSIADPDARENAMKKDRTYSYIKEYLYPRLRAVRFDFCLHRKGMVQDTVHTTVVDSVYMEGVQAIRDRDYEKAITLLRPYNDYNTAVAYCSADYNASAMSILQNLEKTAEVNYMMAVIYARQGNDQMAVQHYMHACQQNNTFVHRGNLDPEISVLIKTYDLNRQDDDEFDYSF